MLLTFVVWPQNISVDRMAMNITQQGAIKTHFADDGLSEVGETGGYAGLANSGTHRQIHNKPDHLPSLVVEAGLEQVRPFCCWYTPPTFHTHFNRILCAVNMFIRVLFKEKYHLYTNNAQD